MLNLPEEVTFTNGNSTKFFYSAEGEKLRAVHKTSGSTTQVDYCDNIIYEAGEQKYLLNQEGYYDLAAGGYHYYLKDHLGNNRVVISHSGAVEQTTHYYPYGGTFASTSNGSNTQPYKYNGKELDTHNGLNWYDYGARHYDPAIARWTTQDPLAEKYYGMTPYNYCFENPIIYADWDGKDAIYIVFPDYVINVYNLKVPHLGHAGVLLIDNNTGTTKYYEYGRYDSECKGIVRTQIIPNVEIGEDGKPTTTSLNAVLEVISNNSGKGGRIEGAYIESSDFANMNNYAEKEMKENSNSERENYSILKKNCATFATDVISQDKSVQSKLPNLNNHIPTIRVKEYRKIFEPIDYKPNIRK